MGGIDGKMVIVYFIYGLSFFILGLISFLLSDKYSQYKIGKFFWLFALFGLLHGANEWVDMLSLLMKSRWTPIIINSILYLRSFLLISSFIFLLIFGIEAIIAGYHSKLIILRKIIYIPYGLFLIALTIFIIIFQPSHANLTTLAICTRYFIGFPSTLLCSMVFFFWMQHPQIKRLQSKTVTAGFFGIGIAFLFYSIFTGLIVPKAMFWPAAIINYQNFITTVGVPVQLFRALCALIAAVSIFGVLRIFNVMSVMQLKEKAELDSLTQLYNNQALRKILLTECDMVKRYGHPLTALFIDIDDFKKYNDTYGHLEGDVVIKKLSQFLIKRSRTTDKVFRYGGEEFVILLPNTSIKKAIKLAERLRRLFHLISFEPKDSTKVIHKTISIGAAEFKKDMLPMELVNQADKAMYKAKREGKNRTCVY